MAIPENRVREDQRLARLASALGLSLAIVLALLKLIAVLVSGSLAIGASFADSLADIVASGVTFLSVRISQQPPDASHRYGHGKAESLSALAQASIVAGSGIFIVVDALRSLGEPATIAPGPFSYGVMVFAVLATLALVMLQRHVVRRTGSLAIAADQLHFSADMLTGTAVLASLAAADRLGIYWLDPVVAVAIAIWLVWNSFGIARNAIDVLMDRELPQPERARIQAILDHHPELDDWHDLRTRKAAGTVFIELHVELDGAMSLDAAHDITDAIEAELESAFPGAEVILHQEPTGVEDARLDHRIAKAADRR